MAELEVLAALGGVTLAILLWAVTNIRLARGVKAIKEDIDTKRTATEKFVDDRLGKLEGTIGGFEARMHAEMPPNVDGRIAEVAAKVEEIDRGIDAALATLDAELKGLPQRIEMVLLARKGVVEKRVRRAMNEAGEEIEEIIEEEVPELVGPQAEFVRWVRKPIDPKLETENPTAYAAQRILKAALAREFDVPSVKLERTGRSGKSPYGL